jgi:hypothetical protein
MNQNSSHQLVFYYRPLGQVKLFKVTFKNCNFQQSSLLQKFVNYGQKSFITLASGAKS